MQSFEKKASPLAGRKALLIRIRCGTYFAKGQVPVEQPPEGAEEDDDDPLLPQ